MMIPENIMTFMNYYFIIFGFCLLSILLFKNNIIFRAVSMIYAGTYMGWIFTTGVQTIMDQSIAPITVDGEIVFVLTIILGLSFYFVFYRPYAWISRYGMAVLVAAFTGLMLRTIVSAEVLKPAVGSILPLWGGTFTPLDNLIIMVGTFCTLSYFILTREHTGVLGIPTKIGRHVIMFTFGAAYAATAVNFVSWLIGALSDWVTIAKGESLVLLLTKILGL